MSTPTLPISGGNGHTGGADDVSVKEPDNSEYQKSLQIVLGTVCGVFGFLGLLLLISILYRLYKRRQARRNYTTGSREQNELNSSITLDLEQKQIPSVLLLYAYDCAAHEKVVSALAGYLIETCNCNVHLDLFEDQIIFERGLDDWLVDRLQEVDYIIVLCSVGARLRCTKKRVRFKFDPCRKIPDYFAVAVDYVAEKMRVERSKGLAMSKYAVVYMDYSTASDIPHQLETGAKFCLMRDILPLFCHLHGTSTEQTKNGNICLGISDKTYDSSELGTELRVAIESAKEFFRCNPNWVEDSMEFIPPPSKSKSRHTRKSSLEPLLGDLKVSMPETDDLQQVNTLVDVHSQTLPRSTKQTNLNMVGSIQNRQNSLPSSLSSHQTLSTPPNHTSKSCDSFQSPSLYSGLEQMPCMVCGKEGEHNPSTRCKGRRLNRQLTQDSEDDMSVYRHKSKSMPTVCDSSIHSSQTVFQADVHKEWDEHGAKLSGSESQDSGSNKDFAMEDLEKDLQSIRMPSSLKMGSFHYDIPSIAVRPIPKVTSHIQTSPSPMPHLPTAADAALLLQPLKQTFPKGDKSSSAMSLEEQIYQLQDIRL
ncbi:interleukin-17 receptor D-like [Pecten maximus]|uniref:interleukin-17 receptor D-like n=1 Tax=Pecten maximus TaxID=6579 RepID=UPI0014590645|nr:interleukin-17 receptor D-like [Pecten maximus]